jgi:hypothetical protein
LYATYANISASDLLASNAKMKTDINVNQPIELFFDQIEDAVDFAAAGKCPYTPEQVTAVAYQLVFKTGMFPDDCKLWKERQLYPREIRILLISVAFLPVQRCHKIPPECLV